MLRGEVIRTGNESWGAAQRRMVKGEYLPERYGIESYVVPEGEGRALECPATDEQVSVRVAVDARGWAAIQALLVNGRERYVERLF